MQDMDTKMDTKKVEGQGRKLVKFMSIQKREDGTDLEIPVMMPINDYFNDGTGVLFYINKCGMIPYDTYMADKHQREVEQQREKEAKEAQDRIAALEAKLAKKGDK